VRSATIQSHRPKIARMAPILPSSFLRRALLAAAALLAGCASMPPQTASARSAPVAAAHDPVLSIGGAVAELAAGMVGARYRLGGADPAEGFDCSGLAFYVYDQAGYRIPRTSEDQFRAAHKIALADADVGDLVFFQDQARLSHVGIYLGNGLFVHAPASGERVSVARVDAPYYQEHLVAVGRLLPPGL
jgi:cell wall-associated NlpC family hydrolase